MQSHFLISSLFLCFSLLLLFCSLVLNGLANRVVYFRFLVELMKENCFFLSKVLGHQESKRYVYCKGECNKRVSVALANVAPY